MMPMWVSAVDDTRHPDAVCKTSFDVLCDNWWYRSGRDGDEGLPVFVLAFVLDALNDIFEQKAF